MKYLSPLKILLQNPYDLPVNLVLLLPQSFEWRASMTNDHPGCIPVPATNLLLSDRLQ